MSVRKQKKRKKVWKWVLVLFIIAAICPFAINQYVKNAASPYLISEQKAAETGADCILVLGAGLKAGGKPSDMLQDRLDKGIELYRAGVAPKLLLSGDNGQVEYNEVNAMRIYAEDAGVPAEDIFLDHAGFSTYESMYRADYIFQIRTVIVVTQKYHQYRALYIARNLGLTAYGVVTEPRAYSGQQGREVREIAARNKDFLILFWKPEPTYLGDRIPITGSGLLTR